MTVYYIYFYKFSREMQCSPSPPLVDIFVILGQIILLDKFFDGTFFTYGIEVMAFADRDQGWVAVLPTFVDQKI